MKAPPKDVDQYLADVPQEMRVRLEELRRTIRSAAPEAEELISYQIPTYEQRGPLVVFGAAKNHAGFYVMSSAAIEAHKDEIKGYDTAKTTIRLPLHRPDPGGAGDQAGQDTNCGERGGPKEMNAACRPQRYRSFWAESFDRRDDHRHGLQVKVWKTGQQKEKRNGVRENR